MAHGEHCFVHDELFIVYTFRSSDVYYNLFQESWLFVHATKWPCGELLLNGMRVREMYVFLLICCPSVWRFGILIDFDKT